MRFRLGMHNSVEIQEQQTNGEISYKIRYRYSVLSLIMRIGMAEIRGLGGANQKGG